MRKMKPKNKAQEIIPFDFKGSSVRVVMVDGEPWFVAKDVCDILGLGNVSWALNSLDSDEKGITRSDTLGGSQSLLTVNESGLYALIFKSKKPQAKAFQKWVTSVVLPSIRKTGGYSVRPSFKDSQEWKDLRDHTKHGYKEYTLMFKVKYTMEHGKQPPPVSYIKEANMMNRIRTGKWGGSGGRDNLDEIELAKVCYLQSAGKIGLLSGSTREGCRANREAIVKGIYEDLANKLLQYNGNYPQIPDCIANKKLPSKNQSVAQISSGTIEVEATVIKQPPVVGQPSRLTGLKVRCKKKRKPESPDQQQLNLKEKDDQKENK